MKRPAITKLYKQSLKVLECRKREKIMAKNRKLFDELMDGIESMISEREDKITLRTHEINANNSQDNNDIVTGIDRITASDD